MGMSDFTGTQAGCARQKGDKIDHLRKELSRYTEKVKFEIAHSGRLVEKF